MSDINKFFDSLYGENFKKYKSELKAKHKGTLFPIKENQLIDPIQIADKDIEVTKILKVRNNNIVTATLSYKLDFSSGDCIIQQENHNQQGYRYSENLGYLNTKGVHSFYNDTIMWYPHFLGFFNVKAYIPKGSYYVKGIDAYNHMCDVVVSDKLIIPKIEIITSTYDRSKAITKYQLRQGNTILYSEDLDEFLTTKYYEKKRF